MLLLVAAAWAGTLTLQDDAGLFDATDRTALQAAAAVRRFDVWLLTTEAGTTQAELRALVAQAPQRANLLAVGVDATHRHTWVSPGSGLRLSSSDTDATASAADTAFREKRWADGVEAILERASHPTGDAPPTTIAPSRPSAAVAEAPPPPDTGRTVVVGVGAALAVGTLGVLAWRARRPA